MPQHPPVRGQRCSRGAGGGRPAGGVPAGSPPSSTGHAHVCLHGPSNPPLLIGAPPRRVADSARGLGAARAAGRAVPRAAALSPNGHRSRAEALAPIAQGWQQPPQPPLLVPASRHSAQTARAQHPRHLLCCRRLCRIAACCPSLPAWWCREPGAAAGQCTNPPNRQRRWNCRQCSQFAFAGQPRGARGRWQGSAARCHSTPCPAASSKGTAGVAVPRRRNPGAAQTPGPLPAPGRDAADAAAGSSSAGTGSCSTYGTSASTAVPRGALPAPYGARKRHPGLSWGNPRGRAPEKRRGPQRCCSATPSASLSTEGTRCPQLPTPATFSSLDALRMSPAPLQGASTLDVALGEQPPSLRGASLLSPLSCPATPRGHRLSPGTAAPRWKAASGRADQALLNPFQRV